MIKKDIYPKTERLSLKNVVYITEKLDGSNLTIFKKDDKLYFATRNNIINVFDELEDCKEMIYKGMYQWVVDNRQWLLDNMFPNSAICGEWLGMGHIKYLDSAFNRRFYMFAKANIDDEWNLYNLKYDHELFKYPFTGIDENQGVPDFIKPVPLVDTTDNIPTVSELDMLYEGYKAKVGRDVEGFVINFQNKICKYVRKKNGKETPHMEKGE